MKILYLALMSMALTACHSYKGENSTYSPLMGTWEQPNVTLTFKNSGNYHYEYVDGEYKSEQSGKYRYFSDRDSIVLYNYYPDAYTKESKNEYWTISQPSSDSFVVIPKNVTVTLYGDTLNTEKEPIEIFLRRNKQRDISDIILLL